MIRRVIATLLSVSHRFFRTAAPPAPPSPQTETRADHHAFRAAPNPDIPMPLPISPPVIPTKDTEEKTLPEKSEEQRKQNRSLRMRNPSSSDSADKSKAARRRQMQEMAKTIEKLKWENAYLRKENAELTALRQKTADETTDAKHGNTTYDDLLAAYDLPTTTVISRGGWTKKMQMLYSQERDAFCDCFQDKYTEEERGRFAEAIRRFAQEGPHRLRNSLKTKILRRELPGTPRDANYSRASHELRFTWKQIGDILWMFCVYRHTSGHAKALDSIK